MTHPPKVRRFRFKAKRSIAGRSNPKTSYRGTDVEAGVYLFGRYRSVSLSFDSQPFSVEYFRDMHELREYRKRALEELSS